MGYNTQFRGSFEISPALKKEHLDYLNKFNQTRRVQRDEIEAAKFDDPVRVAAGLPVGIEGEYCVFGRGTYGQDSDSSILDSNSNPTNQPGLWCKWAPNNDGTKLEWDGAENFYSYCEWLAYLNQHFFQPWGYRLSGKVKWQGEEMDDRGIIIIESALENTDVKLLEHSVSNKIVVKELD